jgi:nicotinamide N-methyltransferase
MADALEDPADILQDALEFLGGRKVIEDEIIKYGDLQLTVAPKVDSIVLVAE